MQKTPARPALTGPRTPFPLLRFGMLLRGRSAVSTIQARVDQLNGASEKTAAQRNADKENLQKQIEETRDVLVKILEAQNGKH